ncbi:MAG: MrcB family domain-containing protein [Methanobacterium sp.]
MLRELFEKVLKEYKASRNENFTGHSIANILRNEIPEELKQIIGNSDKYKVSGSAGQGNWTYSPWVAILDKEITESPQSGYYLVYLFREDMKGVYLSLNQGMTEIKNRYGNNKTKEILISKAYEYREKLGYQTELLDSIDLGAENSSSALFYEDGNIYAKYYDLNNLPSDSVFLNDLELFLNLYNSLVYGSKDNSKNNISIWRIYPGDTKEREYLWPLFKENGFIGIGWFGNLKFIQDYRDFNSEDEIRNILVKYENKSEKTSTPKMIWDFTNSIKIGDYVVASGGKNIVLGMGIIKSEYIGPNDPDNPNFDEEYKHLRKVEWVITDKIEMNNENFFNIQTINALDGTKWNEILIKYCKDVNFNLIQELFNEFNKNYLSKEIGESHYKMYQEESNVIADYFKKIREDSSIVKNIEDPILNYIVPIKRPTVSTVGFKSFKAFGYTNEQIPALTRAIFNLISDLANTQDKVKQKNIIQVFKSGDYSKGLQAGVISPLLHGLNSEYLIINSKTVNTVHFLSNILNLNLKINGDLLRYIDNNEKLKDFLNTLSEEIPEFSDPNVFDAFCHWMCDKSLAGYATGNHIPIFDILHKPEPNVDKSFCEFLNEKGYYFEPEIIENFLLSIKAKPFVILTGNSGTGKTKIAQLFCEYLALENGECHKIVPVGANWTENRHIIGFYNVITKEYMTSDALDLMLEAQKPENKDKPFFLILDEMNLSHVERYFADFLSAMESGEYINLHKSKDAHEYPNSIRIPTNLLVIGTVNVDETTYMFSPKVLDRSNVIEFRTISAKDYMANGLDHNELRGHSAYLEDPLYDHDFDKSIRDSRIEDLKGYLENVKTSEGEILWEILSDELNKFQESLKKAGFDFGFRVIDELLRYMYVSWYYEGEKEVWDNWERYFDAQIKQKMLPKIHGSQKTLENVIKELFNLCLIEKSEKLPRNFGDIISNENVRYHSSALKLQEMDKILYEQRYVAFIN